MLLKPKKLDEADLPAEVLAEDDRALEFDTALKEAVEIPAVPELPFELEAPVWDIVVDEFRVENGAPVVVVSSVPVLGLFEPEILPDRRDRSLLDKLAVDSVPVEVALEVMVPDVLESEVDTPD